MIFWKGRIMRRIISLHFVVTYLCCEWVVLLFVSMPCICFLRRLCRFCLDLVRWLWFGWVRLRHRLAFPWCGSEWNDFRRFLTPGLENFQCSVNSLTSWCAQLMAFRLISDKPSMRLIFPWFVRVFNKHAYRINFQIWHSLRLLIRLFATTDFTFVID